MKRLVKAAAAAEEELKRLSVWYAERDDIPSKKLAALNPYMQTTPTTELEVDSNDKMSYLKLPPIKSYGRNKVHLSAHGWGYYDRTGQWVSLEPDISKLNPSQQIIRKEFNFDSNATKFVSLKLLANGYDGRRLKLFNGENVVEYDDVQHQEAQAEKRRKIKEAEIKRLEKQAKKQRKGKANEIVLDEDEDGLLL